MPVILDLADYAARLDPKTPTTDAAVMLRPEPLEAYPVSTLVNSAPRGLFTALRATTSPAPVTILDAGRRR